MGTGPCFASAVTSDHGEDLWSQQGDTPSRSTTTSSTSHGEARCHRNVGVTSVSIAGDGSAGTTATGDALGKHTDRSLAGGDDPAPERGRHITRPAPASAITPSGGGSSKGVLTIGRASAISVRRNRSSLTTTSTDRLQQHTVGEVAGGDERAIGVERNITGGAAITPRAPESKGGRQIASCYRAIDAATSTTSTTHGLQKDGMGIVARRLQAKIPPLATAAQVHSASNAPVTAAAGGSHSGTEGEAAIRSAGACGGASHHRSTLATTSTDRLQQDRMRAMARGFTTVASDDGERGWRCQLDTASRSTTATGTTHRHRGGCRKFTTTRISHIGNAAASAAAAA